MYKLLLILKYLRKRRIAWVSLAAVTLCTAMVLVVISIMGGWLRTFKEQFSRLQGEVMVVNRSPMVGFDQYRDMIKSIEQLPEVKAACPVIQTHGVVNIYNSIRKGVQVVGYPPDIGRVNGFLKSCHIHDQKKLDTLTFDLWKDRAYFPPDGFKGDSSKWKGMIVGGPMVGLRRDKDGKVNRPDFRIERFWIDLTVLPTAPDNAQLDMTAKARSFYWLIDDSRTGVHLVDSNTVYVPFDQLQRDLDMQAHDDIPDRCNEIQIALKPGTDLLSAKAKIDEIVKSIRQSKSSPSKYDCYVETWAERHSTFIGAVEREKILMTFLFGVISVVAVFLVFCIFYMIVVEKTRDIGIIKSVGATSVGVAGIFLGYGLAIGLIGAALGFLIAGLIVGFINEIHSWLSRVFHVQIYSPETYIFDKLPSTMNPLEVVIILSVAIVASVLGALVPAIRAARMHPIEALRWE